MAWHEPLLTRWPDLIVTFLGVLLGALFAWWIERGVARWQISRQQEAEQHRDKERLLAHLDRIKIEIRDNAATVSQLQRLLGKSHNARVDLFRFAAKLATSLSVAAYEDLARSGLHRTLSGDLQALLFDARQQSVGLRAMIEAGEPAVEFYLGYSGDQKSADLHLDNARTYSQTVLDGLDRAKKVAYDEADARRRTLVPKKVSGVTDGGHVE